MEISNKTGIRSNKSIRRRRTRRNGRRVLGKRRVSRGKRGGRKINRTYID
jgi:hypothetical protein